MKCDLVFKEIFNEFYKLSYSASLENNKSLPPFSDHIVTDYVILRIMSTGYTIYYLYNGSFIFIPEKWIDIFSSLDTHSGDRVVDSYLNCREIIENDSLIRFGVLMINLVHYINGRLSKIDGDKLLETLGELSVIGTKKFRDWCSSEFGLNLDPIEYRSLDGILEI